MRERNETKRNEKLIEMFTLWQHDAQWPFIARQRWWASFNRTLLLWYISLLLYTFCQKEKQQYWDTMHSTAQYTHWMRKRDKEYKTNDHRKDIFAVNTTETNTLKMAKWQEWKATNKPSRKKRTFSPWTHDGQWCCVFKSLLFQCYCCCYYCVY